MYYVDMWKIWQQVYLLIPITIGIFCMQAFVLLLSFCCDAPFKILFNIELLCRSLL